MLIIGNYYKIAQFLVRKVNTVAKKMSRKEFRNAVMEVLQDGEWHSAEAITAEVEMLYGPAPKRSRRVLELNRMELEELVESRMTHGEKPAKLFKLYLVA